MEKEIEILMQYAQAGFSERMDLFLQSPDLRSAFQEMDRKELAAQRAALSSAKQHNKEKCSRPLSLLNRIILALPSFSIMKSKLCPSLKRSGMDRPGLCANIRRSSR